jgi:hypothetical protein
MFPGETLCSNLWTRIFAVDHGVIHREAMWGEFAVINLCGWRYYYLCSTANMAKMTRLQKIVVL